ncbi:serine hydrolase domain-containing protein [Tenuibacillus multivorans]|uniref:CubicO group peptidase, beta-lactamase class C family n=1 Tax=Tenuibacillus multivorans TaxID=237069 RepID=A0A1H0EB11_9BACI|nr:serine hydrolase [Tenuibacillus multivorans]GEL78736.1 penicillin-binding protein [Tenuibacillus multivorans]SDN79473.1 CubicO group peptidase, beta-lactamase class C family [Tenuibacillus multivorans]
MVFKDITLYTEKVKQDMYASGAALVIMKDNHIVHEWYSGTHHFEKGARNIDSSSQFNVYSVRVTYVSLAFAIAIYEGYIRLEDKLSDYLIEFNKEILGETTIRHLLTRSTGLKIKNNSVQRVFKAGSAIEGKRPDLLANILLNITGKTVNEILREKVFKPLNLTSTEWVTEGKNNLVCDIHSPDRCPTLRVGSNIGDDRNLYVSAKELALWGNLHLNKGSYKGKQILPKEIFNYVTTIQSPTSLPKHFPKFGFLWWIKDNEFSWEYNELGSDLPEGSYQILGASSCSCTVIPKLNVVAVRMYNSLYEDFDYVKDIQRYSNLLVSSLKNL